MKLKGAVEFGILTQTNSDHFHFLSDQGSVIIAGTLQEPYIIIAATKTRTL